MQVKEHGDVANDENADGVGGRRHPPGKPSWTLGTMAFQMDAVREAYVLEHSLSYGEAGAALVRETQALGDPSVMMLAKEQYAILRFLARLIGAESALDIGTFTGLSALAFADAMPRGRVVTIDRSNEWEAIAVRHWRTAGVEQRIRAIHAEAAIALAALAAEGARFDIAFIDVDKAGLVAYLDAVLSMLRPGGLAIADNTLWHGWALDPARTDADTEGVRALNRRVARDPSLEAVLMPVADGMTLIRRATHG
jgi:predicted O-methyltransferase YrrM